MKKNKNTKSKTSKLNLGTRKSKMIILTFVFAIIGAAIIITSFAATDIPNQFYQNAAYVNTTNGDCSPTEADQGSIPSGATSGNKIIPNCLEAASKNLGRTIFQLNPNFVPTTFSVKPPTSDLNLDASVPQALCIVAQSTKPADGTKTYGFMVSIGDSPAHQIFFATDSSSRKCMEINKSLTKVPNITISRPSSTPEGLLVESYAIYYQPGYSNAASYTGDEFSFINDPIDRFAETPKNCKTLNSKDNGGSVPIFQNAVSNTQQGIKSVDCGGANRGGRLVSAYFNLTNDKTYRACVKSLDVPNNAYVTVVDITGQALVSTKIGNSGPVSDGIFNTYCSTQFTTENRLVLFGSTTKNRLELKFSPGSTIKFSQAYVIQDVNQ